MTYPFTTRAVAFLGLLGVSGCATPQLPTDHLADQFHAALGAHCGKAYEGQVVSTDPQDADFASEHLVMHVRECDGDVLRIPFHVGENRSRTWVVTRTDEGLRLKHDHRHEDGSEDAVTQYGGDSADITATRAEFPVDDFSIEMFKREGLDVSITNVWAMEITSNIFAYELSREGRFFRVEFDVTKPVDVPPAPWGFE
jgi:hypothetical protein